ncbi:hypothetical protein [Zoogloea sp. 1C4]|uniref:hypothetical protein n=1 Tax=Zoogloea sp. 1C4 TaxID=2570190 RepID=UPI00129278E4|nr:hypothetical protein [Zoogloea sp. 1C4]
MLREASATALLEKAVDATNAVLRNAYFDKTIGRLAVVVSGLADLCVAGTDTGHRSATAKLCHISANRLP